MLEMLQKFDRIYRNLLTSIQQVRLHQECLRDFEKIEFFGFSLLYLVS